MQSTEESVRNAVGEVLLMRHMSLEDMHHLLVIVTISFQRVLQHTTHNTELGSALASCWLLQCLFFSKTVLNVVSLGTIQKVVRSGIYYILSVASTCSSDIHYTLYVSLFCCSVWKPWPS